MNKKKEEAMQRLMATIYYPIIQIKLLSQEPNIREEVKQKLEEIIDASLENMESLLEKGG